MKETLLAMFALFLASTVALNGRRAVHAHTSAQQGDEVEMAALGVAQGALDAAAVLPFGSGGTPAAHVEEATSLAQMAGLRDAVTVPTATGRTLPLDLTLTVTPVLKSGEEFVTGTSDAPFRRVRAVVTGPLGAYAVLERVYVRPA